MFENALGKSNYNLEKQKVQSKGNKQEHLRQNWLKRESTISGQARIAIVCATTFPTRPTD